MRLVSSIADTVLIDKHLIKYGKGSLEDGDVAGGCVVSNVEDIAGVGVGAREDGCLLSILVYLHINADQESARILSGGLSQTSNSVGDIEGIGSEINGGLDL